MNKPVIMLDPGHGGYDPGAVAYGLKEKDLNLSLALKTAEYLDGIKVLLTRDRDVYLSLTDRVELSRRAAPTLFLSLHANAGGGRGFESFIYSGLGTKDPAAVMQKTVHENIFASLFRWQIIDRGLKKASFYVLRQNRHPAILLESLFIDNEREAGIWREPLFVETLASGIAGGVRKALELSSGDYKTADPAVGPLQKTGGGTLYTVQVGAFTYLENARQRLDEARNAGFTDAYIYHKQL